MKTSAQMASENFRYASSYCYFRPACPTFTKPNTHNGYGAILKLLSDGGIRSRKTILEELDLPSRNGYYASVFQRLLWSKLIRHVTPGYYMITQLGRDYVAENLKHGIPAPKRSVNKVCATSTDNDECFTLVLKKSYDAAMNAYKAAMDVYQTIMSQLQ